jgi:energy-coupling factor transporter transmembrane protein EcfT
MNPFARVLYFFILPLLAVLLYPPQTIGAGLGVLLVVVGLFALLASFLWRGFSLALTFSIFVQGMNVIIRLMMFFSNGFTPQGEGDLAFIITSLLGLMLSFYLLLRLDRQDIRLQMIR